MKMQKKIAFVTDVGVYYYKKMPFGLKNTGVTYLRMMDRVFTHQIGCNIEIYVDDMVIKSKRVESAPDDLEKTLRTLLSVNLRLNPEKCTFSVGSGKFLGYMVSQRGIDANPRKIQAVIDMQSPRSIKNVQRLTSYLVALNHFLSRSAKRVFPFFKLLKFIQNFEWT